jgi:FkbM family methyltransferase
MPSVAEALQIGWRRHQAGDVAAAENIYRQVLQVAPHDENAWCFLGMACHDQSRYDEALQAYDQALRIKANFPVALNNLANTLKQLGRLEEAVTRCREALRYKPDYGTAHNNLGVALVAQGRLAEASASFQKALELMPNDAVARTNLGATFVRQGRFGEGSEAALQVLRANPNYAEAHKNQAIVWLLLGDFERGWPEYEWRWRCPGSTLPSHVQPLWDGSPVAGRTLLLFAEQGLGDTLQFVRYAAILREQGAQTIVACQRPLLRLLQSCPGIDQLVDQKATPPVFDVAVPLLSIPGLLRTTASSIPASIPYLSAAPHLVARWRARLASLPGYKVGIAWQGSAGFHADRQRSIPLAAFAPLGAVPGVHLISLQKGYGAEQVAQLRGAFEVVDYAHELDEVEGPFMDTAAIIANLDLVVTADTSIAHLAGALGVPVWIALSISPDWRWLLDREDSPWYPTARLFRQRTLGDWDEVFGRMAAELAGLGRARESVTPVPEPAAPTGFNHLATTRFGPMLINRHDIYIGRSLELYGEFSAAEVYLLAPHLRAGDTVVDAGANIGAHTVPFAQSVGATGAVHAFEPQRVVFQTLCANVALNSLTNVYCRQAALGDSPGTICVPALDYAKDNNFGGLGLGQYRTGEHVSVETLDALQLERCRLIKIDVEGMEVQVLRGARETIARCRPFLYVENDRQEHARELIALLLEQEYRLYWHCPPLFAPDNYRGNPENVFGQVISVNMLCVPQESDVTITGLAPITSPDSDWRTA